MNYNALLLVDKKYNYKKKTFQNSIYNNDFSFFNQRNNCNINKYNKNNQKYKKCYSVKPSIYMMPKDIILRDVFYNSIKAANEIKILDINNNSNINRKYILEKIKKFIIINHINYNIFNKTIYLYDLLCYQREKIENKRKNKFSKFNSLPNLSIAIIAFILILKFNFGENKMISLKKFVKYFEEGDEKITFNEACEMEIMALKLINYNLTFQTPFSFMELFLINGIIFSEDSIFSDLSFNVYELVNETLENIMENSNEYFKYNYFYLCCSVIMHIREKFKINRWPKALEITFGVTYEQFYDLYNVFFSKNNKNKDNNQNKNKNNIQSVYNFDLINISNLKSMSNIISVLKIMKSADKFRKAKEKMNIKDNEKNCKDENINISKDNSSNKIKVGLKKKWEFSNYKSPGKFNNTKNSISTVLTKLNEENKNLFSTLYNKNIDSINNKEYENIQNNSDNINNNKDKDRDNKNYINGNNSKEKEERSIRLINKNTQSNKILKKEDFGILENNKINITKSCNRYKNRINVINKNCQENNNPNINVNNNKNKNESNNNSNADDYSNNTLNLSYYRKRNYLNRKTFNLNSYNEKNKETKNNCANNNANINSYNISSANLNNRINNRLYNNYTEKKRVNELKYDSRKLNNYISNDNLNQTSFNDFLFYKNKSKNKNNEKDNENDDEKNKLKNKEENSNAPTCESSNIRLSINDFSIRKSYRFKNKNTKNEGSTEEKMNLSPKNEKNKRLEKEMRKGMEKTKSYNKLTNNKITFSESTFNRKTGVRKFYKQKNLENH